ncbi:LysR family transcriptional regulator [Flexivirga sp. ID2601S]|uniref:LysR family transcriptional regulator n=1 Tax=Flexivirga aerilata TaxID=1656889 RepID=A0A849AFF3_9MICO|nr:LysR family transcriptional regulator [Flexivirga aerilata]NNG38306.1 LysR family transcriptional regulator [Flexivirga aerilata]
METRQLEYFVAVAGERSFTRAAERLNAVQSTVSAGIAALEKELRYSVFVRSTRKVELTALGAELLPMAEQMINGEERMRALAGESGSGLTGRIRMGTISNLGWLDLPGRLGEFHREHPGVQLSMVHRPRGSTDIVRDLRAGRLDVGLVGLATEELGDLAPVVIDDSPLVAVLPRDHRLAGRPRIELADLADEPFVDMPPGFGNRLAVERHLRERKLRRRVVVEVPDLATVPEYVGAGLGVAVVPDQGITGAGVVVRPLTAQLRWRMSVVSTQAARGIPAVEALLRVLDVHRERE